MPEKPKRPKPPEKQDDGFCHCRIPLLDSDLDIDGDDDFCWRCKRPIAPED